jgi:hypothetical protein
MGVFAVKLVNRMFGTVVFDVLQSDSAADAQTAAVADPALAYQSPLTAVASNELVSDLQPNQYNAIDTRVLGDG